MRTWTDAFLAYVGRKKLTQLAIALEFECAPSKVNGWFHGAMPRAGMRKRIQRWSGGAIPADLPAGRVRANAAGSTRRTGTDG